MTRFFHGLTLFVTLACLGLFGDTIWAKAAAGEGLGHSTSVETPRAVAAASSAKAGRRATRRKVRRTAGHVMTKRRVIKRRMVRRPAKTKLTAPVSAKVVSVSAAVTPAASLPELTQVAEEVAYQLAGHTVTADGALARMWYSRAYTVKSPYAYVGRMRVDGREVHVWMETTGNLLASAMAERSADPLPDIAALMERFPDGGMGVVIADPNDFAPPSEPAVEVVEFAEPSR